MRLLHFFLTPACLVLVIGTAPAQEGPPPRDEPLDLLEHALGSLDEPLPEGQEPTDEAIREQLSDLREVVMDLQRVVDEKLVAIQQLEDENEKLRQALRLRFSSGALPPVPIANRELLESVLKEAAPEPERKETRGPATAPETFTVVSEWGRSPEVAASLPGDVSSLIGLTIAVDRATSVDALSQLGAELRDNYSHYDNINIEVFDDIAAARKFADEGNLNEARRVMSVSRFKHSGRDDVTVYRDGVPVPNR